MFGRGCIQHLLDDQQGAGHDPKGPTPAARPGPGQSRLFRAARQWLWHAQEPAPDGAGRLRRRLLVAPVIGLDTNTYYYIYYIDILHRGG